MQRVTSITTTNYSNYLDLPNPILGLLCYPTLQLRAADVRCREDIDHDILNLLPSIPKLVSIIIGDPSPPAVCIDLVLSKTVTHRQISACDDSSAGNAQSIHLCRNFAS